MCDAAGAGAVLVRDDGTIGSASAGFEELLGGSQPSLGADLRALLPELPSIEELPPKVGPDSPAFVHGGAGRTRRVLTAACVDLDGQRYVIVAERDRQGHRRAERRDGPIEGVTDGPTVEAAPARHARVRAREAMPDRVRHALALARSYGYEVSVMSLELGDATGLDSDGIILGCVRGVDDVARGAEGRYLLLLPDTDEQGARVVGRRICSKLQGFGRPRVGVAQSFPDEPAEMLISRAESACVASNGRRAVR